MKQWGMAYWPCLSAVTVSSADTRGMDAGVGGWVIRDRLPDPSKWAERRFIAQQGSAQCYTVNRENARVLRANRISEGRKKRPRRMVRPRRTAAPSVTTDGTFALAYGRVESGQAAARARRMWPAIWMLAETSRQLARCGEIDIMEF